MPDLHARLKRLAAFRDLLEAEDFDPGSLPSFEVRNGEIAQAYAMLSKDASAFVTHVRYDGWVRPDIKWPTWSQSDRAHALFANPEAMHDASAHEHACLLTSLVRQDRFVEGTLVAAFASGLLLRIVRRADVLARDLGPSRGRS